MLKFKMKIMTINLRYIHSVIGLLFLISSINLTAQEKDHFSEERYIQNGDTLRYRMLLPKNFDKTKQYPLVLFLHGAGERGNDNKKQLVHGSHLFLNDQNRDSLPSIVIFPQCSQNDYWSKLDADRSTKPITFNYKYDEPPTTALALVMGLMDNIIIKPYVKKRSRLCFGVIYGRYGDF